MDLDAKPPLELSRVARVDMYLDAIVTLPDRTTVRPGSIDVAALRAGAWPTGDTEWQTATLSPLTVVLAGADADPADAVPVPVGTSDLWARVEDEGVVVVAPVRRIVCR